MDHIHTIQEIIDVNRELIPTGVVTDVMCECQSAYQALPKLWIIHYVEFCAISKNSINHEEKSAIVEEDANLDLPRCYWFRVLDTGKIPPADKHKDIKGGCVAYNGDGRARVIMKIEQYRKRACEVQVDNEEED